LFLESCEDEIAMKGRCGVFAGDIKIRLGGIDGDEEAEAAFVHLQAAHAKAKALGQNVEAVADLHDAARSCFIGEEFRESFGLLVRDMELPGQRFFIQRLVSGIGQQGNERLTPMEWGGRLVFFPRLLLGRARRGGRIRCAVLA
jgi:hypothetical protein